MKNHKDLFKGVKRLKCGFTTVKDLGKEFIITHNGNMGNSITTSVDPNLERLGFPPIEQLKNDFEVSNESGYPDYAYSIVLKSKK